MSGCRVARRVALIPELQTPRARAARARTLATKVFAWLSQSFHLAAAGRRPGPRGGYLTGVGLWRGSGGKRRIALRGALPTTPLVVSPFATNEWCCEEAL